MKKYVDVSSLNFRSEPKVTRSNRIGVLHLGQLVDVRSDADDNFVKASANIDGVKMDGFLSGNFLRDPVSDEREALIHQAITEWKRFNFGLGKEHKKPYFEFVGEMWKAIGMVDRKDLDDIFLDGKDRGVPWSAAAISFMVRNAGKALPESKYLDFCFAAAHSRYVHDSIVRRNKNDETSPFWGFDLHERRPKLGDIVCRGRGKGKLDFDIASRKNKFSSHCDIIVRIKTDSVIAIGGNVAHSVKVTEYEKTPSGFLDDSKKAYALLANRH